MIIDFEGEPVETAQRAATETVALRDVAGMLRSFQYAAYRGIVRSGAWSDCPPRTTRTTPRIG